MLTISLISGCHGQHITSSQQTGEKRFRYPDHWWAPVPQEQAKWWEVLPQEAGPGEVILSKRHELGLLSNLAASPFTFHGQHYLCLEAFWQMMKYPEGPQDPRAKHEGLVWQRTRQEVSQMEGWAAKKAGTLASENMKIMDINWVTFEGQKMTYRSPQKGPHYQLIVQATREKVRQNPQIQKVLLSTGDLILRPDHQQPLEVPPAWQYHQIYMDLRDELQEK